MTTYPTPNPAPAALTDHRNLAADYQTARARHEADPTNPALRQALAWVLADLLKAVSAQTPPAPDRMLRGLAVLADLDLDNPRWRESVLWSVNRFLLRTTPQTLPLGQLAGVVRVARQWVPTEPGLVRSVWWKALLRHADTGMDWLGLADQLGWDAGFRADDFVGETLPATTDGAPERQTKPLVERLTMATVKQLLGKVIIPDEVAAPWLARLTDLAARYPDWDFLPYYHAQLLQRLHRPAEAMAVFLPFARRKKRDFWVWSLLADLLTASPDTTTPDKVLACYARALTAGAPEPFLVKVRQRLAALLIGMNRWADARAEIDRLVQTRQAQNWPLPSAVMDWLNDIHYTQATPQRIGHWYEEAQKTADALLWHDLPETIGLVIGFDPTGKTAGVALTDRLTAWVPVAKLPAVPAPGDRLAVRYVVKTKGDKAKVQVLTIRLTAEQTTGVAIRTVTGPLRVVPGKGIGFVRNVYVGADLLTQRPGLADELVRVVAVARWDAVKQQSGWRAFQIEKESVNLLAETG